MSTEEYQHIVGVFRDQARAEEAAAALKEAGLGEDTITYTRYESERPEDSRILVHVQAPGRELDAVTILTDNGANNSDIPAGTELAHGEIATRPTENKDVVL